MPAKKTDFDSSKTDLQNLQKKVFTRYKNPYREFEEIEDSEKEKRFLHWKDM